MRLSPATAIVTLAVAAGASALAALAIGSVHVPLRDLTAALSGGDAAGADIVLGLRLPRVLSGFAVGAALALSGALLQALLRNPLADPYVLGISGGAAVAALAALALGLGAVAVQGAAITGALLALALLFVLARRALYSGDLAAGDQSAGSVLLTGVMVGSFAAALMSLLLTLAPDGRLRPMVFWLLGDLSGATDLAPAVLVLALSAVLLLIAHRQARSLNLMLRGELQAYTQGVRVDSTRRRLVLVAAIATAVAVTLGGAVGFVGFIAPHLVRQLVGNDQRTVLPAAMLLGGTLVVVADTVARTALAPLQLPVGVLTALIGVPVFLWLLGRR
ncbi:MAG TPA: iron ABC transporter permease [Burkholderiaceae bacterium]|nr:iron ABC transporter permease [Burkholderiaceae bacterium]HQR69004.1 iron ABC transporter permease [Burkholderiaceae bacterium]